jgi:hypothetical protein
MRHGDEVVRLPEGFEVVARSVQGAVAAIENREKCWALLWSVSQFSSVPCLKGKPVQKPEFFLQFCSFSKKIYV